MKATQSTHRTTQGLGPVLLVLVAIAALVLGGCGNDGSSDPAGATDPAEPAFDAARFSAGSHRIDHPYLPLTPGTAHTYLARTDDGAETVVTEVLETTRTVAGVECTVFHDRVYLDELLVEDTFDWFAQDDQGNVWYLGEDVVNYEYDDEGNLLGTDGEGSWEAGVDGAVAGILMKAHPSVGDSYQQEYYEGVAEDMAEVVALDVTVTLADDTTYTGCVKTREWNPLEPGSEEYKYYAPDVGLVREEAVRGTETVEIVGVFLTGRGQVPDFTAVTFSAPTAIDNAYLPLLPGTTQTYRAQTGDGVETTVTEVLEATREVAGVEAVVFRDRVYLDSGDGDVLIEDTEDWFAQDDLGNVWYLGEQVVNYEYDDEGNLLGTDGEGSWEAGVDGALPGVVMWAAPPARTSYYQEYYEGEAEDMGFVAAAGVDVQLGDGTTYTDCLQILDWNPLEPATLEYKYYAPGVGLVREEVLGGGETVDIVPAPAP